MTEKIEVHGSYEPRFEKVKEAFIKNFEDGWECGASVAVTIEGKYVIDIWGGYADEAHTVPWEKDTICNVYSTTKVPTVLCTLMCVDRGLIDLDAPVAKYWPEFAQNGKENMPVRYLFSHTSGLAGIEEISPSSIYYDWEKVTGLLAAQKPWWEPGTRSGYHAITHGYLLGELVRRVTGKTLGTFFREEVAEPLDIDFHIGLPKEHNFRVSNLIPGKPLLENFMMTFDAVLRMANRSQAVREEIGDWTKNIQIDVTGFKKFELKTQDGKLFVKEGIIENPDCTLTVPKERPNMVFALFPHVSDTQEYISKHLKITGDLKVVEKLKKIFSLIITDAYKKAHPGLKMMLNPITFRLTGNDWEWRSAEIPAANGHGNARSVAKFGAIIANNGKLDGKRFLSEKTMDKMLEEQINNTDLIMMVPLRFGLGVGLPTKERPKPNPRSVFWGGAGGSSILMDLDAKMSIAYVMNQMRNQPVQETQQNFLASDSRANRVTKAVYESLGLLNK
jgi:CubicO group peptidase (beta-lactamase class C family)